MSTKQKSRHKWSEGTCVYMFIPILTSHFYYTPKSLRWNLSVFIHVHSHTTNLALLITLQISHDNTSDSHVVILTHIYTTSNYSVIS